MLLACSTAPLALLTLALLLSSKHVSFVDASTPALVHGLEQALKVRLRQMKNAYNAVMESAHGGDERHGDEEPSVTGSPIPSVCSSLVGERNAAELSHQSDGRWLRRRLTANYLIVGEDIDTLEEKFIKTLDAEVSPKFFLWKQIFPLTVLCQGKNLLPEKKVKTHFGIQCFYERILERTDVFTHDQRVCRKPSPQRPSGTLVTQLRRVSLAHLFSNALACEVRALGKTFVRIIFS